MRAILLCSVAVFSAFMARAEAQSVVKVAPSTPHPAQSVTVSGSGFGNSEAIDVYLDTADVLLLVSSGTGTLSGPLSVPAATSPGVHYVTAVGRHSGVAAQSAFTVTTAWSQAGFGNAHLGLNPYENTLNSGNVNRLGSVWAATTGTVLAAPAVVSGRVFSAGADGVHGIQALAVATGKALWNVAKTDLFYASPTVAGSVVYIGSLNAVMYAVNAATGATIWTATLGGGTESSAAVANGIVYVGSLDGKVYALSTSTGAVVWTYTTNLAVFSSPAIARGIVYIGSQDRSLYALDAATGALVWQFVSNSSIPGSPAVANGRVFFGSDKVYALRAGPRGGQLIWSVSLGEDIAQTTPVVANGRVIIGSQNGTLVALDTRTGANLWSVNTGGAITHSSAVAAGDLVYIGNDSDIFLAIGASNGAVLASAAAGSYVGASAAVSDGELFFSSEDYTTYAFALDAGQNAVKPHVPQVSALHPDMGLAVTR
jgi:outer membrane protein assembly factor BamB